MENEVRKKIDYILRANDVDAVVAVKEVLGTATPCLFKKGDDLSTLRLEPHYPVATLAVKVMKDNPSSEIAILCRGCDERALLELAKRNQIDLDKVVLIGIACDKDKAKECNCSKPFPDCETVIGEKLQDIRSEDIYESYKKMSTAEKLEFWKQQFEKCNKCYGCRNICQMCFCKDCELENELWLKKGRLPPDFPVYHLIRAFHLAGKCVGCGECETACPAGIPLMTINRLLRDDMKELFGFVVGESADQVNPLYTKEEF